MRVTAATIFIAHTFGVVQQAEVAAVVHLGDVFTVCRSCVYGRTNPKPQPYLHLWDGVLIVLLHLVTPPALRLGRGGVACRLGCLLQAAC